MYDPQKCAVGPGALVDVRQRAQNLDPDVHRGHGVDRDAARARALEQILQRPPGDRLLDDVRAGRVARDVQDADDVFVGERGRDLRAIRGAPGRPFEVHRADDAPEEHLVRPEDLRDLVGSGSLDHVIAANCVQRGHPSADR